MAVDVLIFLEKDYAEDEALKICKKLENMSSKVGAYYASLLKTKKDIVIRTLKEEFTFEGIEKTVLAKRGITATMEELRKTDMKLVSELAGEKQELMNKYWWDDNSYDKIPISKDKYAVLITINTTSIHHLADFCEELNVPYIEIWVWEDDEPTEADFELIGEDDSETIIVGKKK